MCQKHKHTNFMVCHSKHGTDRDRTGEERRGEEEDARRVKDDSGDKRGVAALGVIHSADVNDGQTDGHVVFVTKK